MKIAKATDTLAIRWDGAAPFLESGDNPTPPYGQAGYLQMTDDMRVRAAVFAPAGQVEARGTIVIMTGYGEFLEKYFETIHALQAAGFGAALMEWRGHGLSTRALPAHPLRLHLQDFDTNITDLEQFWARVVSGLPRPHFGLAHSMGGLVAIRAVQRHPEWLSALALSSPLLGLPIPRWIKPALFVLLGAAYHLGFGHATLPTRPTRAPGRRAQNDVTNDAQRFARNEGLAQRYPELLVGETSLAWIRTTMQRIRASARPAFLQSVQTPVWMGMAQDERIVSLKAERRALTLLPQATGEEFAHAQHELLQEQNETRERFLRQMLAYFARHAP